MVASVNDFIEEVSVRSGASITAQNRWDGLAGLDWIIPAHSSVYDPLSQNLVAITLSRGTHVNLGTGVAGRLEAECRAGSLSFVPAGMEMHWNLADTLHVLNLFVPDEMVLRARDALSSRVQTRPFLARDDAAVSHLGRLLAEALKRPSSDQAVYVDGLALALTARVALGFKNEPETKRRYAMAPAQLRRAVAYIEGNLDQPITLSDIAAAAGLSEFHFARAFRVETGTSPHSFLTQLRIARAERLLGADQMALADIAVACGYQSISGLQRAFVRATGQTAAEARKR